MVSLQSADQVGRGRMVRTNLEDLDEQAPCFGVVALIDGAVGSVFPVGGGLWGDASDGETQHAVTVIGGGRVAIQIVGAVVLSGQLGLAGLL
ncbi:MAG: hypothetical protein JXQ73_00180 [Phycisphaerae bacterium]|nr:hypothetical protein [Phycisphaerae bacterium]